MPRYVTLPIPNRFIQHCDQSYFLREPKEWRKKFYIYPFDVYEKQVDTNNLACWVIKDSLFGWLKSQAIKPEDFRLNMGTSKHRHQGWTATMPLTLATLYKLTWL